MSFKTSVSLLILDDLSIDVSGVLTSPTFIVLLSISHCMSVNICFICLGAPILGACMLTNVISSSLLIPLSFYNALLCLLLWTLF